MSENANFEDFVAWVIHNSDVDDLPVGLKTRVDQFVWMARLIFNERDVLTRELEELADAE